MPEIDDTNAEEAGWAPVSIVLAYTSTQLQRVRERAAELDNLNLGGDNKPEAYTPAEAFARMLAQDDKIVDAIFGPKAGEEWAYTGGYTTDPDDGSS